MRSEDLGETWHQFDAIRFDQWDAPNFGQVFPFRRGDYVYLYGLQGGRLYIYSFESGSGPANTLVRAPGAVTFGDGLKLARVHKDNFEDMSEYEYFTGLVGGVAQWSKGAAGLLAIRPGSVFHNRSFLQGARHGLSEFSVFYNDYLGRYVLSYFDNPAVVFRTAENPWGPWGPAQTVVSSGDFVGQGGLYGGFSHSLMTTHNGQRMFFAISHWVPTYNVRLIEAVFN